MKRFFMQPCGIINVYSIILPMQHKGRIIEYYYIIYSQCEQGVMLLTMQMNRKKTESTTNDDDCCTRKRGPK